MENYLSENRHLHVAEICDGRAETEAAIHTAPVEGQSSGSEALRRIL